MPLGKPVEIWGEIKSEPLFRRNKKVEERRDQLKAKVFQGLLLAGGQRTPKQNRKRLLRMPIP